MANSPPSARSVEKVCRIGLRSARPLVSISTRPKCGILPRSRSATSRRNAICKSVRVLQHRQPLPSSVTSSLLSRSSASSMPSAPNSLTISAVPWPSGRFEEPPHQRGLSGAEKAGDDRHRQSRAPRSRFCRRPKRPADWPTGNRSRWCRSWCRSLYPPPEGEGQESSYLSETLQPGSVPVAALEIHLQDVQPADVAVDACRRSRARRRTRR